MALTRKLLRRHAAAVSGGTVTAVEESAGVSGDAGGNGRHAQNTESRADCLRRAARISGFKRRARPNRARLRANISQRLPAILLPLSIRDGILPNAFAARLLSSRIAYSEKGCKALQI